MVHMFIYWLILIIEPLYTVLCYCAYESFLFQNCVLELHFLFTGPVFHTLCYAKRNITTIKINSIFFFQYSVPQSNLLCILTWKDSYNFFSLEFQFFSFLVEKKKICVHNIPQFPIVLIWSFTGNFLLFRGDVLSLSTPISCSNLNQYVLDCLHSLHANTSLS